MKPVTALQKARAMVVVSVLAIVMALATACGAAQSDVAARPEQAVVAAAAAHVNTKIAPQQYKEQFMNSGAQHQLIDVRTPEEFASGHIPGAVNIPVQELSQRLSEVKMDQPVVLYCRSGNRSAQAAQILSAADHPQIYDLGGIAAWQQAGLPIE